MDLELQGKHVLITGGSRGIGLACAQAFAAEGARVTIVSRQIENVAKATAQLRGAGATVQGLNADLVDPDAALRMLDQAEAGQGAIDVLVCSAGAARHTPFGELTAQDWHDAMESKFFSYVHVMDPVAKRMGQRGSGAIVNVIGMGGKQASSTHLAGGAANAALMLVTAGLASAYAPLGVRINGVNPGMTLTGRLQQRVLADARQQNVTADEVLQKLESGQALRRIARPEEIADAVMWLASARASYVSGALLAVNGAMTSLV